MSVNNLEWKNLNINNNQIEAKTDKAILINCPQKSNYKGFSFWHPAKLVRKGKHSEAISIGYTDEFKFNLIKYGKGKWNSRNIIEEKEISLEEFEEMFDVVNENIKTPLFKNEYETYKPDKKQAVNNNLKEDLLDE